MRKCSLVSVVLAATLALTPLSAQAALRLLAPTASAPPGDQVEFRWTAYNKAKWYKIIVRSPGERVIVRAMSPRLAGCRQGRGSCAFTLRVPHDTFRWTVVGHEGGGKKRDYPEIVVSGGGGQEKPANDNGGKKGGGKKGGGKKNDGAKNGGGSAKDDTPDNNGKADDHASGSDEPVEKPVFAGNTPYPRSDYITGMSFRWNTLKSMAQTSDIFFATWARNGRVYTTWGDGSGFRPDGKRADVSIGIAELFGSTARTTSGRNLIGGYKPKVAKCFPRVGERKDNRVKSVCKGHGMHGKSFGMLALDNHLYMFITPGSAKRHYIGTKLYRLPLGKAQVSKANWLINPKKHYPILNPTLLQAGRNYSDGGNWVYAYGPRFSPKNIARPSTQTKGEITLFRAPRKSNLLNESSWEYFSGFAGNQPRWSKSVSKAKPVFKDRRGVGWSVSATYVKQLDRYFLITEHDKSRHSRFGIFESKNPWGPWKTVYYGTLKKNAKYPTTGFFAQIWPHTIRNGGRTFSLMFTGVSELDALQVVDVDLKLNPAKR